jgi:hypothetical protein
VQDGEHSAKYFSKKIFAECRAEGHSAKKFSKKKLSSVGVVSTRQRFFLKKIFAECHAERHSAKKFSKKNSLPSAIQRDTRQSFKKTLNKAFAEGKMGFAECPEHVFPVVH